MEGGNPRRFPSRLPPHPPNPKSAHVRQPSQLGLLPLPHLAARGPVLAKDTGLPPLREAVLFPRRPGRDSKSHRGEGVGETGGGVPGETVSTDRRIPLRRRSFASRPREPDRRHGLPLQERGSNRENREAEGSAPQGRQKGTVGAQVRSCRQVGGGGSDRSRGAPIPQLAASNCALSDTIFFASFVAWAFLPAFFAFLSAFFAAAICCWRLAFRMGLSFRKWRMR